MTAAPDTDVRLTAGAATRWTLALTQFLLILDTAVLNVAVPHVAAGVGMGETAQSWIINAFVVPFAGLLLAAGYAADRLGRRRILAGGLVVLAVGAAIGTAAVDAAAVLVSRVVQGVGGAMAGAAAMSLVFALFSGADRGRALALFATMAGAGGVAGTIVGGTATDWLGWRSLFALNVVAAVALAVTVRRVVPRDQTPRGRTSGASFLGPASMTVALAGAAYALTSSAENAWRSPHVWAPALIAVAATAVFAAVEAGTPRPVIPRAVWRTPALLGALTLAGAAQFALVPTFLLVSVYAQQRLGYTPSAAGLVLLPMSLLIVAFAPTLPRLLHAVGSRPLMVAAFAAVAAGALWLSRLHPDAGYLTALLGPTLVIGLGVPTVAMTTNLATAATAGSTPPGVTAGLLTTSQQFGAALGLAALPTLAAGSGGYQAAFLTAAAVAAAAAAAGLTAKLMSPRPRPWPWIRRHHLGRRASPDPNGDS